MEALVSIAVFLVFALVFVLAALVLSRIVQPRLPGAEKQATYECGEPTIGPSWVQFDLRFYIVALFYLVFDVEVALLYPWATIFRKFPTEALVLGLPFLAIVVAGYAYEWHSGSLDWVRSAVARGAAGPIPVPAAPTDDAGAAGTPGSPGGPGSPAPSAARLARVDPEVLAQMRKG